MKDAGVSAQEMAQKARLLSKRIDERFAKHHLSKLAKEMASLSEVAGLQARDLGRPLYWARFISILLAVVFLGVLVGAFRFLELPGGAMSVSDGWSIFESVLVIGSIIAFLLNKERRVKRKRVRQVVQELGKYSDLVMQLQADKDPERFLSSYSKKDHSPDLKIHRLEDIPKYLDYCEEILMMIAGFASLYSQNCEDQESLASLQRVQNLCNERTLCLAAKLARTTDAIKYSEGVGINSYFYIEGR